VNGRQFYKVLRGSLFHCTSRLAFGSILKHGVIKPNTGEFPWTYPQSQNSYGSRRGKVCLFDFERSTRRQCLETADRWRQFLQVHQPYTVVIGIDRAALPDRVIEWEQANHEAWNVLPEPHAVIIPYVEVWVPEVPVSAFKWVRPSCRFCKEPGRGIEGGSWSLSGLDSSAREHGCLDCHWLSEKEMFGSGLAGALARLAFREERSHMEPAEE
jgi:hypothetical protein